MIALRAFGSLYRLLLRFYPRHFRDEFASEMRVVFEDALVEAAKDHPRAACTSFWRELRDWPRAVIVAQLQERRRVMRAQVERGLGRPVPWWITVAAVSLFALPVLLTSRGGSFLRPIGQFFFLALLAFVIVAFVIDATKTKAFPRWSLPYAGLLAIVFVNFGLFRMAEGQIVRLKEQVVTVGDELSRFAWGAIRSGLRWFFVLALLGLVVLVCAVLPSLRRTFAKMRRDWPKLSFLLYGAIVFICFFGFDEYQYEGPYMAAGMLSLALGAWFYLQGKTIARRILPLLAGATLAMWIMAVGKWLIVPRQDWPVWFGWHPVEVERWFESGGEMITWVWVLAALSAPALLGLLPGAKEPAAPVPSV